MQRLRGLGETEGANREARTRAGRRCGAGHGGRLCRTGGRRRGLRRSVAVGRRRGAALRRALRAVSSSAARKGAPRLQQIDGGLGYYGQFSNPLPTSASYFPIAVWGAYSMETLEHRNGQGGRDQHLRLVRGHDRLGTSRSSRGRYALDRGPLRGRNTSIGSETFGLAARGRNRHDAGAGCVPGRSTRSRRDCRMMVARGT